MNLAQVLHQRWAAAGALGGLLPAARVFTGLSVDSTPPFAVIGKISDRPLARYHDGSAVDAVGVRIQVFHEQYDAAAAIAQQVKSAFDRTEFPLAGSDKVLCMQRTNDFEQLRDDGLWEMTVEFECTVYLAAGT